MALICVANGKLLRDGGFQIIWVQPGVGDAGGAIGAALAVWHLFLGKERNADGRSDIMAGSFLGPAVTQADIESRLAKAGARFTVASEEDMIDRTASSLAGGEAVGWMQGRMEFGPRALSLSPFLLRIL